MPWLGKDKKGNTVNGNDMIQEYIAMYYRAPKNFESMVYLSQLTQAEGLKYIIQGHRSHKPYCWGSMYWQIDDCWPTVSWSTIDYFYRWKAAHYFVRKAYKPIIVNAIIDTTKQINIQVITDEMATFQGKIIYKLLDFAGKTIKEDSVDVSLSPNSSNSILRKPLSSLLDAGMQKKSLLLVSLKKGQEEIDSDILYFEKIKNIDLPSATLTKKFNSANGGVDIELSADRLIKNIYLSAENYEGFFSDNYFDVIPGRTVRIHFDGTTDAAAFEKDLKIMSVKDSY
jgi:beta-mannosidase